MYQRALATIFAAVNRDYPSTTPRSARAVRAVRAGALLLLLHATAAIAQPAGEHEHVALSVDPSLDLGAVLDATTARHPGRELVTARRTQADAWTLRGDGWLAGVPALFGRYHTDRFGNNNGLEEWESGLELPLWRWGQKGRVRAYSQALDDLGDAAAEALRWEAAGELRTRFWQLALAALEVRLAHQTVELDQQLVTLVEQRHKEGDVPRRDLLLANDRLLASQADLLNAQAMLADGERSWVSLTGLSRRPDFTPEPMSPFSEIPPTHPLLVMNDARVRETTRYERVAEDAAREAPMLMIGPRAEKPASDGGYDTAFGLTMRLPLGGSRQTAVPVAEAGLASADARSNRELDVRQLELDFHEAVHQLSVNAEQLTLASEQAALAARRAEMADIAYREGEFDLEELLRAQQAARNAERSRERLTVMGHLLVAMYNQAVGDLP